MVTRRFAALAVSALIAGASFGGVATAEEAKLKAAFFAGGVESPFRIAFNAFVEHVNANGAGLVQVADVMGPESVPQNQQPRALADGLVDIVAAPPSYIENLLPGMGGLSAARITTQEMREAGVFDIVNGMLTDKSNVRLLALYAGDIPFYIYTSKPVRTLADFKGLRLRATNTNRAFFGALDAEPMQVGRGEIYTALERGVADGYSNINSELFASSWIEVVDYRVGPGFYAPNIAIFINADRYDAMSDEQKAVLEAAALHVEGEPSLAMRRDEEAAIAKAVAENGLEVIEFSPEETARFLDLAYDTQWSTIMERAPELGGALKPILLRE